MNLLSWLTKRILNGIVTGAFFILTIAGVTYALTYNWSDPSSIRNRTVGNPLTASGWNLLVGNVDNLNERVTTIEGMSSVIPAWAVMAFNLATCPTGWSPADGTNGNPDLRWEFIRGLDNGRGVDSGRTLSSTQVDSFKSHAHQTNISVGIGLSTTSGGYGSFIQAPGGTYITSATGGTETRPRNIAFLYCIKN